MASYTHYWTNPTYEEALANGDEGRSLDHVGGNLFKKHGVKVGDRIYVITVINGELFLVGRLTASVIVHSDSEAERLLGYRPWPGADHLIATKGECTPQNFGRKVPLELVTKLTFESTERPRPLKFKSPGVLDQQTLRGVRKLTRSSAELLDSLLKQ